MRTCETDTPRTDDALRTVGVGEKGFRTLPASFCRTLEIELTAALARIAEMEGREPEGPSACLRPAAGKRECFACWESHPELHEPWRTRANCVLNNRRQVGLRPDDLADYRASAWAQERSE